MKVRSCNTIKANIVVSSTANIWSGQQSAVVRYCSEISGCAGGKSSTKYAQKMVLISSKAYFLRITCKCSYRFHQKLSVSDLLRKMKGWSSHKVQREFPQLKKRYWSCHFWGRGCFSTTNGAIIEDIVLQFLDRHIGNPIGVSR